MSEQPSNKRGSIELARRLCFEIAGPTDEDDCDGRGYGSVDVAEILSAEIEALRAKLADCQAVIRSRGHDEDCPASSSSCAICGLLKLLHPCVNYFADGQNHQFNPGPCSDACGHDRTTAPSHPPAAT